jgi:hypothetical protein
LLQASRPCSRLPVLAPVLRSTSGAEAAQVSSSTSGGPCSPWLQRRPRSRKGSGLAPPRRTSSSTPVDERRRDLAPLQFRAAEQEWKRRGGAALLPRNSGQRSRNGSGSALLPRAGLARGLLSTSGAAARPCSSAIPGRALPRFQAVLFRDSRAADDNTAGALPQHAGSGETTPV